MTTPPSWTFTDSVNEWAEPLVLNGSSAPIGRPYQNPVAETEEFVRSEETYYNKNDVPTIHDFGMGQKPWTLKGRWSDKQLGTGMAEQLKVQALTMLRARNIITVEWGNVLNYTAFMKNWKFGHESPTNFTWQLELTILKDNTVASVASVVAFSAPSDAADVAKMMALLAADIAAPPNLDVIKPNLLDFLDSLVNAVSAAAGMVADIANTIASWEQATFAELNAFRAGVMQLKTAAITLVQTWSDLQTDTAMFGKNSANDLSFLAAQSNSVVSMQDYMDQMDQADQAAAIVQTKEQASTVVAIGTDATFDAMAGRVMGDQSQGAAIAAANQMPPGARPHVGTKYKLPAGR